MEKKRRRKSPYWRKRFAKPAPPEPYRGEPGPPTLSEEILARALGVTVEQLRKEARRKR